MTFDEAVECHLQLLDVVVQIQQENAELWATLVRRQMPGNQRSLFGVRLAGRQPVEQTARAHLAEDRVMIGVRHCRQTSIPLSYLLRLLFFAQGLQLRRQALEHSAVERVAVMGLPQPVDDTLRRIVIACLQQVFLPGPYTLEFFQLNAAGRHRVQQKLELGQQVKKALIVERHLDVLAWPELALWCLGKVAPGGLENQLGRQRPSGDQAVRHGREAFQGQRLALRLVEIGDTGRQGGEEFGKGFALGHRLGIGVRQRVVDLGVVVGETDVDLAHDIRNRQDARLGVRQQVVGVADFLPFETGARRQCRVPVLDDRGAAHAIERRHVLVHEVENAILGTLRRVVFADFLVASVVADAAGQRQVHQAVAVAQSVVAVGLQEVDRLGQRFMQDEIVVGRQHHVGRGQLLHAVSQFGLHAPIGELRHMVIIDRGKIAFRPIRCGVKHHDSAGQAAVVLHRPTQKSRPIVSNQHHGQQLV